MDSRRKRRVQHPIDMQVGSRIRLRRLMMGLSQTKLADLVGISPQRVQKYEHAENRIGASQLYKLARAMNVPVSFFFDAIDPERASAIGEAQVDTLDGDLMGKRETRELIDAYYAIYNDKLRRLLWHLAKNLCKESQTPRTSLKAKRPKR